MANSEKDIRKPTIVVPYMGLKNRNNVKDLFIYLRPETNGVRVESILFSVIHEDPLFRDGIELVYLANLPGDFVTNNRVIEQHYNLKCEFSKLGRVCFTPLMVKRFEDWFKVKWDDVEVVSAYKAIEILGITSKELFDLWVKDKDFFYVHGQSIKKVGNLYVINYDIPELLQKNSVSTDIAVMVLRTGLSNRELTTLISKMERALKEGGAVPPDTPPRRCFHYTKSPLEEILDGFGYLYTSDGKKVDKAQISFYGYLKDQGFKPEIIERLVKYPIVEVVEDGIQKEVYLYDYLMGDSYKEAYEKISRVVF